MQMLYVTVVEVCASEIECVIVKCVQARGTQCLCGVAVVDGSWSVRRAVNVRGNVTARICLQSFKAECVRNSNYGVCRCPGYLTLLSDNVHYVILDLGLHHPGAEYVWVWLPCCLELVMLFLVWQVVIEYDAVDVVACQHEHEAV